MRIIDLKEEMIEQDFLTREQLDEIQKRLNGVLNGNFEIKNDTIFLKDKPIIKLFLLGSESFYLNCVQDMRNMVRHILSADEANDILLKENISLNTKVLEQQEQINLLSKKIAGFKYESGDWILDV